MVDLSETKGGIKFGVKVIPRSSKTGFAGEIDGFLRIKLSSPPVDGAANSELVKMLARHFKVAASSVRIIRGESSKTKTIEVDGIDISTAKGFLNGL